jgi:hypothetical protein
MTETSAARGSRRTKFDCLLALLAGLAFAASADQIVYSDSLQNGWQSWGWATLIFTNNSPVHGGADSISVTTSNYSALYLHVSPMDDSGYTNLTFWINGGAGGGQTVRLLATLGTDTDGTPQTPVSLAALPANSWVQVSVSLAALGVANAPDFNGFWIQSTQGGAQPTFYVDDIMLIAGAAIPPVTNMAVTISVDAQSNRTPISPLIYGTAFATAAELADLNFTANRSGGNEESTYNWQIGAHGKGADYYFESYPDSSATPGASTDGVVAASRAGGAQALITIPMMSWSPKVGVNRGIIPSYSIAKYGPQTGSDPYHPDAGNGVSSTNGNRLITNNDPNDAYVPVNSAFQQSYVQHLITTWGNSTNGGVRYYIMDNEHSIWFSTHQDIHPVGPTMQEILGKMIDYASMVKSNDPNALVLGPEEWGWNGYFFSGYDQQNSGQHDRAANGGWDYLPWLLHQIHQHDLTTGKRLLDYFTLHCYPQENNVGGNAVDSATQALRNASTRQFWDTNYMDPSWINSVIMLIPRMKNWVATNYPGTKIGVTEYNWGAEPDINGATAQADLLGIFGREGLDLATRWTTPDPSAPTYLAMKIYHNYDGNKSTFGDVSVSATGPNPDDVSTFAAVRSSDGALTVMVINKMAGASATVSLNMTNFAASGTAQTWQLTASNVITRLNDSVLAGHTLSNTVPAQSITLFVLPSAPPFQLRPDAGGRSGPWNLWLDGQAGQTYILQSSTNLASWAAVSTNTLSSNSVLVNISPLGTAARYYRGLWVQ